ncbi:MAG: FecR family protein [Pedobacter sp.]|nr:MAG: FecR family protein [Pedobacter sp.]
MDQSEFEALLARFAEGKVSEQERRQVDSWLTFGRFTGREYTEMELEGKAGLLAKRLPFAGKGIRLWKVIASAAAILVVGLGMWMYWDFGKPAQFSESYANDVSPGTTGATLTLADGRKINLANASSGEVAKQAGIMIRKTADGSLSYEIKPSDMPSEDLGAVNTLSTGKGETYRVKLPDGSIVHLNAASSLTYPANLLSGGKRSVSLQGEGYFDVAKDKVHPFIVKTAGQTVEVLGTHFNINAYGDEPVTKTTLLEGSVRLSSASGGRILRPNEQAAVSASGMDVKVVDTEEVSAWKNSEFLFKEDDFKANMRKIARWYDVQVIYEKDAPQNFNIEGFSSRARNLSFILKMMEKTGKVHFRIEGKKVYVSK